MYKIGISAAVTGIDEQSVKDATEKIQQLMEKSLSSKHKNALKDIFQIPKLDTAEAEKALKDLNIQITNIKNNIATIKFSSDGISKEIDVRQWGNTLRVVSDVYSATGSLEDRYKALKADAVEASQAIAKGNQDASKRLQDVNKELERVGKQIKEIKGQKAFEDLESSFSSVQKVQTIFDSMGQATGRIVTFKSESGELTQIFQSWNEELKQYVVNQSRVTDNYAINERAVEKLNTKIETLLSKERDTDLINTLKATQQGLKEVDVYSDQASKSIKEYEQAVSDAMGKERQKEQVMREYTATTRNLYKETTELRKAEIEASSSRGKQNEDARERIRIHQEASDVLRKEQEELGKEADALGASAEAKKIDAQAAAESSRKVFQFSQEHERSNNILKNFAEGLKNAADRVINYTLAYRAMDAVTRAFRNSIQTAKELDAAFTDIEMVLLQSGSSIDKLKLEYADLAQEMSATIVEVAQGSDEWLRQGKTAEETATLLKASMVMSRVGQLESADATSKMTAVLNGYKLEAEDAMRVVDMLSQVDVKSASSVGDLAEALQRSANSANEAGVSMEMLIGYIATIRETTQRSANTIGESLKTILSRMGSVKAGTFLDMDLESEYENFDSFVNDVEKVLSKVGIALRDTNMSFRNTEDVLGEVASKWKTYTDVEKNAIATAIAGVRQRNNFIALMQNYDKALMLAGEALGSEGAAMEKYGYYQDSIAAKMDRITASWQEFIIKMQESEIIGDVLSGIEGIMSALASDVGVLFTGTIVPLGVMVTSIYKSIGAFNKMKEAVDAVRAAEETAKMAKEAYAVATAALKTAEDAHTAAVITGVGVEETAAAVDAARTAAVTASTVAIDANTKATIANNTAKKMTTNAYALAFIGAAMAVMFLVKVIDKFSVTDKKLRENLDKSAEELENTTNKIKDINNELETTQQRIEELQKMAKNGGLLPEQQDELETLKETNRELQQQLINEKALLEIREQQYKKDAEALKNKKVDSSVQFEYNNEYTGNEPVQVTRTEALTENVEELQNLDKQLAEIDNKYKKINEDLKNGVITEKEYGKQSEMLGRQQGALLDKRNSLMEKNVELSEDLSKIMKYLFDPTEIEEYNKALDSWENYMSTASEKFDKVFNMEGLEKAKKGLVDMAESGDLSAKNLEASGNEIVNILADMGLSYDEIEGFVRAYIKSLEDEENAMKAVVNARKNYGDVIDDVSSKLDLIIAAEDELKERGTLSTETVSKLTKEFGNLDKMLTAVDDGFVLADGSLGDLVTSMRKLYEMELNNAITGAEQVIQAEAAKKRGYEKTTGAIEDQLRTLRAFYGAQRQNLVNEALRSGLTQQERQDIYNDYQIVKEQYDTVDQYLKSIENSKKNLDKFDEVVRIRRRENERDSGTKITSITEDKPEEGESEYEFQMRYINHQIALREAQAKAIENVKGKEQEYITLLEDRGNAYIYAQQRIHDEAERIRSEATDKELVENSEEIQELQRLWWDYEEKRRNLAEETADFQSKLLQDQEDELQDQIDKAEDLLSDLQRVIDDLMRIRKNQLDDEKRTYDYLIKQKQATLSLYEGLWGVTDKIREEQKAIADELEISKESYKYLDENLRKELFNEDDYNNLSNILGEIGESAEDIFRNFRQEIEDLTEFDIYKVEEITAEYERQYNMKLLEYEIAKAEMNVVKKQTELQNILSNRNVRMFTGGQWVWTSDHKAVQEAMKDVKDAENERNNAEIKRNQQMVIDWYNREMDHLRLQSEAAQNWYDELERQWERIQAELVIEEKTFAGVLQQIIDADIPILNTIISNVGGALNDFIALLGGTKESAGRPFGDLTGQQQPGGSSYDQQYLQNKILWQEAKNRGDYAEMARLEALNAAYRQQHNIPDDTIPYDEAVKMLQSGVYRNSSPGSIFTSSGSAISSGSSGTGAPLNSGSSRPDTSGKTYRWEDDDDDDYYTPGSTSGKLSAGGKEFFADNYDKDKDYTTSIREAIARGDYQQAEYDLHMKEAKEEDMKKSGNWNDSWSNVDDLRKEIDNSKKSSFKKKYDRGGILSGIGGIKATSKDEVIFDEHISAKILDPIRSKEFLNVADGLSSLLDNANLINSFIKSMASGQVTSSTTTTTDSHDIYLPEGFVASMSKEDSEGITKILKRYIPITR